MTLGQASMERPLLTSSEPNSRAEFWYSVSYAKVLYPIATMASQRISDALAEIGLEENRRLFYHKYIEFVTGCRMDDTKASFDMVADGGEGNGIDASTIKRTLLELKGMGIDVKFALLDVAFVSDFLLRPSVGTISPVSGSTLPISFLFARVIFFQDPSRNGIHMHK